MLRKVWYFSALFIVMAAFAVLAAPHLYAVALWNAAFRAEEPVRARRASGWLAAWSGICLGLFFFLLRVRLDLRIPETDGDPEPAVVIGNHRHDIDALLYAAILRRMGYRSVSAVAKRELGAVPVIGRCLREIGAGLVARSRDRKDLDRVRACAEFCRRTGSSLLIFPEGTTYIDGHPRRRGSLKHLLVPKTGGMKAIREVLYDRPILSVTVHRGADPVASTLLTGTDIIGRCLKVETELKRVGETADIAAWLAEEWESKDAQLASMGQE